MENLKETHRIKSDQARWTCDPAIFDFNSTEELESLEGIFGQHRGIHSLSFGSSISNHGFNIFLAGAPGTRKLTAVKNFLAKKSAEESVPSDWCYVFDFDHPDRPQSIELPAGKGREFVKDMELLVEECAGEIPKAFEEEEYDRRKSEVVKDYQEMRTSKLKDLDKEASAKNFLLEFTPLGVITIPVVHGKPLEKEAFNQLPPDERERIRREMEDLENNSKHYLAEIRSMEKEVKEKLQQLDREIALFAVGHFFDDLRAKYADREKVVHFLEKMQEDIVENLDIFKESEQKQQLGGFQLPGMEMMAKDHFERYKVNLMMDNAKSEGAPVIVESNPTYYNLFGKLEYKAQFGAMSTSFTQVRAGSIHRANGGYLVLDAMGLLRNFFAYEALKRVLKTRELRIENIGEQFLAIPASTLRPEPIPLSVKVVLIGHPMIYHLLHLLDEDFQKLFKVKADFDTQMKKIPEHLEEYARFVSGHCKRENVKHFDREAVAKIAEHGARVAADQEKLTAKLMDIEDLIVEAGYWADQNGNSLVTKENIQQALDEKIFRSNMIETKLREMIQEGTLLIDTEGSRTAQINGLAVLDIGDYRFGKPSRITSRVGVGTKGVIGIEREAKMSGRIHNKAVLIVTGYLSGKYAMDKPLTMTATITFEQLYDEIEGDSATCAEIFTLLSDLSGLPLDQSIAVTGSANQHGEVQAIGGVNNKIEGFFDVCKMMGMTGQQGVMIPKSNLRHLMLREDVVEAIKNGQFNIWAIDSIDQGMTILTGREAGERRDDGTYAEDTVNYLVAKRLEKLSEAVRKFGKPEHEHSDEGLQAA